jgi:hypothetical protein
MAHELWAASVELLKYQVVLPRATCRTSRLVVYAKFGICDGVTQRNNQD